MLQQSFSFKSKALLLKDPPFFHWSDVRELSLCNNISATTFPWRILKSPLLFSSSDLSGLNRSLFCFPREVQTRKSIIVARRNRRRNGWRRSIKVVFECISFIASSLDILPEPFDLVIREFGGGNGGGLGFRNGFGGGGFGGWSRRRRELGFFGFLVVCALGLLLILKKEIEIDLILGVLGLSLLGFSIRGWKRGIKDWILGFCCCTVMVLLGLRREELQRWIEGSRFRSPVMEIMRRGRRR